MERYIYFLVGLLLAMGLASAAPQLEVTYSVTPESINPGGSTQVILNVQNLDLTTTIEDVQVQLKGKGLGISVVSSNVNIGDISPLSSSSAAFAVKAGDIAQPGTYIVEAKGTYEYESTEKTTFTINIPIVVSYRSTLGIYAPDTQITPGATGNLLITLNNAGGSEIKDVVVTLAPTTTYVYPVGNVRSTIASLGYGQSSEVAFQIRASDSAPAGIQTATVSVTYTDTAGSTQTDTQSIAITVVDAGTELVIDNVESNLEPGKSGAVWISVKNVGEVDLENLYFSLAAGTGLNLMGSNEKLLGALNVGETKKVEFDFEVAQDAEAQPVASTLSVRYRRAGGKNEIVDSKPIGIVVSGSVDLRIIDKTPKPSDGEIEVDIANYGNKDADAVRVEALANGIVFGTGFTDQIKANKHKVFRFDMPSESQVLVRISYKDYGEASGTKTVEEPITLNVKEVVSGGSSPVPGILLFVAVLVVLFWYLRRRKRNGIKIDVSKYKDG